MRSVTSNTGSISEPLLYHLEALAKYKAWKELGDMEPAMAMQTYSEWVKQQLLFHGKGQERHGCGGGGGVFPPGTLLMMTTTSTTTTSSHQNEENDDDESSSSSDVDSDTQHSKICHAQGSTRQ